MQVLQKILEIRLTRGGCLPKAGDDIFRSVMSYSIRDTIYA